jgi:hypothetical protein
MMILKQSQKIGRFDGKKKEEEKISGNKRRSGIS